MYTQSTCSTWVKSVLLFVTLVFVPHNLRHRLPKGPLTHPFYAAMLMAQTRSKIIFLRPKVGHYTEKKFQTLIFMAYALRNKKCLIFDFSSPLKGASDVLTYSPQTALNLSQNPVKYVKSCRSQTFSRNYTSNFALFRLWPPSWNKQ